MKAYAPLKSDTVRQFGRYSPWLLLQATIFRRTFRPIVTLRLCQMSKDSSGLFHIFLPIFKLTHRISTHRAAMDLSWRTKLGAGLAITHGWGLVISPGAVIGNNVTLFHGVTLGQSDSILSNGLRTTMYPTVMDDVWIGPHAIVVGGVTVGEGSRIAGGAFVTEDIPANCLVVGNPAKIVKRDCIPDVMNRAPILS